MKLKHGEYDQKFARRSFSIFMFVGRIDGLAPSPRVVTLNLPPLLKVSVRDFSISPLCQGYKKYFSPRVFVFSPFLSFFFTPLSFPISNMLHKLQVTSNQQLQTKYIHSICSTHTYKTRNNFKFCMITR